MNNNSIKPIVAEHPRQDINRKRESDPSRLRYSFARELLPKIKPGARLIDVGGGAGEFCALAREQGYITTLADGNLDSVISERQRGAEAIQVDLTAGLKSVEDDKYDVVVCLEVIEHIVTAELLLRELSRVMKPEGALILSTPNFGFLKDRLSYLSGKDVREEGYHFRFYTLNKLQDMCSQAGMVVEKRNSMASAMGVNYFFRVITGGKFRIKQFSSPSWCESWLTSTFVWRLRKR